MKTAEKIKRLEELIAKLDLVKYDLQALSKEDLYVIDEVLMKQLRTWQNQERAYTYLRQQRDKNKQLYINARGETVERFEGQREEIERILEEDR